MKARDMYIILEVPEELCWEWLPSLCILNISFWNKPLLPDQWQTQRCPTYKKDNTNLSNMHSTEESNISAWKESETLYLTQYAGVWTMTPKMEIIYELWPRTESGIPVHKEGYWIPDFYQIDQLILSCIGRLHQSPHLLQTHKHCDKI